MKKIVAPQKQSNGKTYWNNIGLMGVKNGKVWIKLNMIPTGWDGYCMGVDPKEGKGDSGGPESKPAPETEPSGGADTDFTF